MLSKDNIKNLFDYNLYTFQSPSGKYGVVTKQLNSIKFENTMTTTEAIYFNASNKLELKSNTTYTSKCTVIFANNGSQGVAVAGNMACSILIQDTANYYKTYRLRLVNGYVDETGKGTVGETYELYTTFTTPDNYDLEVYKFLATRVSAQTSVTFKDLILVEGDYDKDTFPL